MALEVETPEPEELAAVAAGVLEEAAAVVEEAAAALAEPVIEVEPAELLEIEEVPAPEELAPVAELAPIAEPEPVFEEVAVPAFPEPAPQAIEDIWPSTEQEIYRPATELRFAEDLDIFIPGRGGNKSKGKKRKGAKRGRGPGGGPSRGPGGGMSRGPGGGGPVDRPEVRAAGVDRPEVRGVAASLHSPARQGPVGSRVGGVGFSDPGRNGK